MYDELQLNNGATTKKITIYALLVGITDYPFIRLADNTVRFPQLMGCVRDVEKIRQYLESQSQCNTSIKCLTNQDASKKAIVQAFQTHLSQATEDDFVIFYYSGHGTQEYADEVFTSDTDHRLESIVCFYDSETKNDCLLADKEIRYLLHQIATKKPSIITLFDCCHSAGITRNASRVEQFALIEKRIPYIFKQRDWDQFIFSDTISRNRFLADGEAECLPEADSIHYSACESHESAVEYGEEGVFTKYLLKVLSSETNGISYRLLHQRMRQYLRGNFEQNPRMIASNQMDSFLDSGFLGMKIKENRDGEIIYNGDRGWHLNIGAIQGVYLKDILIYDAEQPDLTLNGRIVEVHIDYCVLSIAGNPDRQRRYYTSTKEFLALAVRLYVEPVAEVSKAFDSMIEYLGSISSAFIKLCMEEVEAELVLHLRNGLWFFSNPGDELRPLVRHLVHSDPAIYQTIESYILHIAKWKFIRNLINNDSETLIDANHLEVLAMAGIPLETTKIPSNNNLDIVYQSQNGSLRNKVAIKLTNRSSNKLYVGAIYLNSQFESYTQFLNPTVYTLLPDEEVWLRHGGQKELAVAAPEMMRLYNWKEMKDCLKFIISTDLFDISNFHLDALPEPKPAERGDSFIGELRTKGIVTEPKIPVTQGWTTRELTLTFINPDYSPLKDEVLLAGLNKKQQNKKSTNLNTMQTNPVEFISNLELQSPEALFKGAAFKNKNAVVPQEEIEQSFINNKTIISFVSSVSAKYRNDVLDSTLLAQLAANKKYPDQKDALKWYEVFTDTLEKIGWITEGKEFSTYTSNEDIFEIKDVVISILAAAFGGTFMGVITKTLESIKKMGDENGTILAFKRNTHSVQKGCFQVGLAVEENDSVSLQLGTFVLESKNKITQILFVKTSKDSTTLRYNSRRATLGTNVYTDKVRDAISNKLGEQIEENIAEIDIDI